MTCSPLTLHLHCSGLLIYGWLLLRDAMNGAQAPDQIDTINPDDLSRRKKLLQNQKRALVVRALVGGDEHDAIGDVKVCVARRETVAVVCNRAWHRQGHNAQWLAVLVGHFL